MTSVLCLYEDNTPLTLVLCLQFFHQLSLIFAYLAHYVISPAVDHLRGLLVRCLQTLLKLVQALLKLCELVDLHRDLVSELLDLLAALVFGLALVQPCQVVHHMFCHAAQCADLAVTALAEVPASKHLCHAKNLSQIYVD